MTEGGDLDHYVQRRRLATYEQVVARHGYAYGVDVRRARWLARSTLGNAAVRGIDRAWSGLAAALSDELDPAGEDIAHDILEPIVNIRAILRGPLPAIRLVTRRGGEPAWPWVTPLGATHGDVHWLVVDAESLRAASPEARRFALASGLAHLQCGHGIFFTAHLLVARHRATRAVRTLHRLLTPWSKVMAFSADRGARLASNDLSQAIDGLRATRTVEQSTSWWPRDPGEAIRTEALREFDRSAVVARVTAARAHAQGDTALLGADDESVPHVPDGAWSLARCDRRLTERLRLI